MGKGVVVGSRRPDTERLIVMATRFVAAPGPPLAVLGLEPHHWERGTGGRFSCAHCPLPRRNRVHDEAQIDGKSAEQAEWSQHYAARLGERD